MKQICPATFILLSIQLLLTPNVPSAARDPDAASAASCSVHTSDISIPTSSTDIQDIVTKYVADPTCYLHLQAAIESIFREEQRREEWAGPLERIVRKAALEHGAKMVGFCHTSICRYDIELTPSEESARSPHEVERRIIDATSGTPLQVDSLRHYGSNFKFTIYFFSTIVPSAFLESLRKKMQDAN
jgi:hypothetical protein